MQQVIMETDPEILAIRADVAEIKKLLIGMSRRGGAATDPNDWMTAPQFLMKFQIGRSTLKRRVAAGEIEVHDGYGNLKRYRWKQRDLEAV